MTDIILVVDDEDDVREAIVLELQNAGYGTIELNTGEQMVTMALEIQPAAIVLDLAMPVMTGYEALLELKENSATAGIPVIVASAQRGRDVANMVRDLGAAGFLSKPWQDGELVTQVQQAIDSSAD
jgi:CheY-like chemotaxis protein